MRVFVFDHIINNIFCFFLLSGKMYWIHSDREQKLWQIEQSSLDGSGRRLIHSQNVTMQSLTIDFDDLRVYYVYDNSGIAYYDIAKEIIKVAWMHSDVMTISSVTVYNGSLYFPENIQSVIMRCEKDACQDLSLLRKNTSKLMK